MTLLVYAIPECRPLAESLVRETGAELGELEVRRFPDGEDYVRLVTAPAGRSVALVCGLERPDEKILPAYFAACAARELGAVRVGLIAPYLGYMRQDARFKPGEAITSVHFAHWLSSFLDWIVTVDPHLHRHASLDCVYSIPATCVAAAPAIARWIRAEVIDPLVVGPDAESAQWAERIAAAAECPFVVATKQRHGDRDVTVTLPDLARWRERTPVLVDDVISTGRTMIAVVRQLRERGVRKPAVCIGVHALFAADALAELSAAGAGRIVTCNTVTHATNAIDVAPLIASAVRQVTR